MHKDVLILANKTQLALESNCWGHFVLMTNMTSTPGCEEATELNCYATCALKGWISRRKATFTKLLCWDNINAAQGLCTPLSWAGFLMSRGQSSRELRTPPNKDKMQFKKMKGIKENIWKWNIFGADIKGEKDDHIGIRWHSCWQCNHLVEWKASSSAVLPLYCTL